MLHQSSGQPAPIDLVTGELTIQLARLRFARVVLVPMYRDLKLLLLLLEVQRTQKPLIDLSLCSLPDSCRWATFTF